MDDEHWDDIRVFLAIMDSSSLREAASKLQRSHPTVRRRLARLERDLGLHLFDRRPGGLTPTHEARQLVASARAAERAAHRFRREAVGLSPKLEGNITISAPDILMSEVLAPAFTAFCKRWPKIQLTIHTTYDLADLSSREADIAFRVVDPQGSPKDDLIGVKACSMWAAIYGSDHQWIGWSDDFFAEQRAASPYPDLPVAGRLNNIYLQREACIAGMGLALLPCFMAPPGLTRQTEPTLASDIWLLVHKDLRQSPHLKLFRTEMLNALKALRPLLTGETTKPAARPLEDD